MGLFILFSLIFSAPLQARVAPPGTPSKHLIVLVAHRNREVDYKKTVEALQAEVSDLPAQLRVIWRGLKEDPVVASPAANPARKKPGGETEKTKTAGTRQARDEDPGFNRLLTARRVAQDTGAVVVIFCEFEKEDMLWLYIAPWVDRRGVISKERVITRRIEKAEAGGRYEALALILRLSIKALMFKIPLTKKRVEETSKMPPDPPLSFSQKKQTLLGLATRAEGVTSVFSQDAPLVPGVSLELSFKMYENINIFAGYTYFRPVTVEGDRAAITLTRHPGHLGVQWRRTAKKFSLSLSLAAILDFVSVNTRVTSIYIEAVPSKAHQTLSLLPMVGLRYRLTDRVTLTGSIGAELFLNNHYYVVEGHEDTFGKYGTETIIDPWMIQPRMQLGVEVALF